VERGGEGVALGGGEGRGGGRSQMLSSAGGTRRGTAWQPIVGPRSQSRGALERKERKKDHEGGCCVRESGSVRRLCIVVKLTGREGSARKAMGGDGIAYISRLGERKGGRKIIKEKFPPRGKGGRGRAVNERKKKKGNIPLGRTRERWRNLFIPRKTLRRKKGQTKAASMWGGEKKRTQSPNSSRRRYKPHSTKEAS